MKRPRPRKAVTTPLASMILGALEDAGGRAYLASQAAKTPSAFLTLVARILPTEAAGADAPDDTPTITVTIASEPEPPREAG